MDIYYINIAARTDRRAFMETQFARLGLTGARVDALTPVQLSTEQIDRRCNPARGHWLEPGALCCSLSHLEAIRRVAAGTTPFALILEDDAILSSRLPEFLVAFDARRPPLDLLRIETTLQSQRMLPSGIDLLADVEILRTFSWPGGSAAYIISRRAAEVVIGSGELERKVADQALLDPYEPLAHRLVLRQTRPGLVIQSNNLPPDASANAIPNMGSDIAHGSRDAAERPYYWQRLPFVVARWLHRDIIVGGQKTWHQLAGGAKKQFIPFAP